MIKVNMKSLKREIAKLNKSGILEENVDATGETKDVVEKFCDSVEQALKKDEEGLKELRSVVETYNDLVAQLDGNNGNGEREGAEAGSGDSEEEFDEIEEQPIVDEKPPAEKPAKKGKAEKAKKPKPIVKKKEMVKKVEEKKPVKTEKTKPDKVVKKESTSVREAKGTISWDKFTKAEKKYISWIGVDLMNNRSLKDNSLKAWSLLEDSKKQEYLAKYKERKFKVPAELKK